MRIASSSPHPHHHVPENPPAEKSSSFSLAYPENTFSPQSSKACEQWWSDLSPASVGSPLRSGSTSPELEKTLASIGHEHRFKATRGRIRA